MKTMLLVLTMMAAVVRPQPTDSSESDDLEQWELFKMEYGKKYGSQNEQEERKSIFMKNLVFVREHNAKYERGESTFNVKINRFADWTAEEWAPMINCFKSKENRLPSGEFFQEPSDLELPPSVDWREKGAVTPIKNQEDCGSCWAFSSTGSLEGQTFLKTSKLVSLSEQNLIDCSTSQGTQGCNGGDMDSSFQYVKVNNGIDTEESYPYEAEEHPCRYDPKNKGATDSGFVDIPSGSEDKLQAAVATVGPISVAIDANHTSFQFYSGGVYYEPECSTAIQSLDHAFLAIGYGNDKNGGDYWLVKNSWGTAWGIEGYMLMSRNRSNHCGIATAASYPIV